MFFSLHKDVVDVLSIFVDLPLQDFVLFDDEGAVKHDYSSTLQELSFPKKVSFYCTQASGKPGGEKAFSPMEEMCPVPDVITSFWLKNRLA